MFADLERMQNRSDLSRKYYQEALDLLLKTKNRHGQGMVQNGLGELEIQEGNLPAARNHLLEAKTMFGLTNDKVMEQRTAARLADLNS